MLKSLQAMRSLWQSHGLNCYELMFHASLLFKVASQSFAPIARPAIQPVVQAD